MRSEVRRSPEVREVTSLAQSHTTRAEIETLVCLKLTPTFLLTHPKAFTDGKCSVSSAKVEMADRCFGSLDFGPWFPLFKRLKRFLMLSFLI